MIFETFTLSKNSWHVKLMRYCWKLDHADFTNMCPYFWLTICNCVFVPFIALAKGGVWVYNKIQSIFQQKAQRWAEKEFKYFKQLNQSINDVTFSDFRKFSSILLKTNDNSDFMRLLVNNGWFQSFNESYYNSYNFGTLDSILTFVNEFSIKNTPFITRFKEYLEEQIERQKAKPNMYCSFYKYLGTTFLIAALGFICYFGYWILSKMINSDVDWLLVFGKVVVIAIGAVVIFLILYPIPLVFEHITSKIQFAPADKSLVDEIVNIWDCFKNGVIKFCQILYQLYKNNCPGIDWKDE